MMTSIDSSDDIQNRLVTEVVAIGQDEAQRVEFDKPFPLVLSPVEGKSVSFVTL